MKIQCPHCNECFDPRDAIVKVIKSSDRWFARTKQVKHCPLCQQQFIVDISRAACILMIIYMVVVGLFAHFEYTWSTGIVMITCMLAFMKYKEKMIRVMAK